MDCLDGLPGVEHAPPASTQEDLSLIWAKSCRGELSHGGHVLVVDAEVGVSIRGRPVSDGVLSIGLRLVGCVWCCPTNMIDDEYVFCACAVCDK